jgi:hypothetical protein
MADDLISDLTDAAALDDTDLMEVEQGTTPTNTSGKITLLLLRFFALLYRINVQTGTSYTLSLSDAFKMVAMNNGSANMVTIPKNATTALPVGYRVDLAQFGAGQTSIAPEDGAVSIRYPATDTLGLAEQYAACSLLQVAADEWLLVGRMEPAP